MLTTTIDTHAIIRKLKPAIRPAIQAGMVSPDEVQIFINHLFQNPYLLDVFQYTHEKPEQDYFVGFDCLTSPDFNQFIDDLIDNDGEHPINWSLTVGTFKLHCLNRYVSETHTLTQSPNGSFITTLREGTVDTYLIIELDDKA